MRPCGRLPHVSAPARPPPGPHAGQERMEWLQRELGSLAPRHTLFMQTAMMPISLRSLICNPDEMHGRWGRAAAGCAGAGRAVLQLPSCAAAQATEWDSYSPCQLWPLLPPLPYRNRFASLLLAAALTSR